MSSAQRMLHARRSENRVLDRWSLVVRKGLEAFACGASVVEESVVLLCQRPMANDQRLCHMRNAVNNSAIWDTAMIEISRLKRLWSASVVLVNKKLSIGRTPGASTWLMFTQLCS